MTVLSDLLLDELADKVAERVIARLSTGATKVAYTTAKRGPHLPGKSRAWMLRNVKMMRGAKRIGRDWVISADDFEAWLSERDDAEVSPPVANDVDALVEKGLRQAGFRRAR